MTSGGAERTLRGILDNWHFWMFVAFVGIALTLVWVVALNQRTARQEAGRVAEQRAENVARVEKCFSDLAQAPALHRILAALEQGFRNQLGAAQAALEADPGGPLRKVRRDSIRHNRAALADIRDYMATVQARTPTRAECRSLASGLGVRRPR
ncbi:MAG: hypothetical protein M3364_04485 [Actinomycetota bacterium]|nr:hypothetical protein [Actinomycetota bacterium]